MDNCALVGKQPWHQQVAGAAEGFDAGVEGFLGLGEWETEAGEVVLDGPWWQGDGDRGKQAGIEVRHRHALGASGDEFHHVFLAEVVEEIPAVHFLGIRADAETSCATKPT